jgi:regulator of replication initiation timing
LQKQAKSLSETTKTYLDQNAVLVHENEVLRKAAGARKRIIDQADDEVADSSSVSDSDRTVTLVAERDAWQQKYVEQERRSRELERNLESLKKQAAAQSAEYLRLTSEKEGLQRQYGYFLLL